MNDLRSFQETEQEFKHRREFKMAYNTLQEIITSKVESPDKVLSLHQSTYFRLLKSFYHLEKLEELRFSSEKSVQLLQLIFVHYEELLSSLLSSIDAVAYEINEVYELNLGSRDVEIYKVTDELPESQLSDLLQREIQSRDRNHWYRRLRRQRNIAIHRPSKLLEAVIQAKPDIDREEIKEDIVAGKARIFEDSHLYYESTESLITRVYQRVKHRIIGKEVFCRKDIKGQLLWMADCPYCKTLIAWREKRTAENWPTDEEKAGYDLVNIEREVTARSLVERGHIKIDEDNIDVEDTVCILEKLPTPVCPGCGARVVAVHDYLDGNINEVLEWAGDYLPLSISEEILGSDRFWEQEDILFGEPSRIVKRRRRGGGLIRFVERKAKNPKLIDEYKGKKIYERRSLFSGEWESVPGGNELNGGPMREFMEWSDPAYLFFKDRDKAISVLEGLAADEYYNQGNIAEAKKLYEKSLRCNSENGYSLVGSGKIDLLEGKEKEGIAKCLRAGEINKKCYFSDIALVFYERENLDKAREWFEKDFDNENTATTAYNLGVTALGQDDVKQAIQWFRRSLELDPEDWDCYLILGKLREEAGKTDEAIRILEQGMDRVIDTKRGSFFYKDQEKAEEMYSSLRELQKKKGK